MMLDSFHLSPLAPGSRITSFRNYLPLYPAITEQQLALDALGGTSPWALRAASSQMMTFFSLTTWGFSQPCAEQLASSALTMAIISGGAPAGARISLGAAAAIPGQTIIPIVASMSNFLAILPDPLCLYRFAPIMQKPCHLGNWLIYQVIFIQTRGNPPFFVHEFGKEKGRLLKIDENTNT